MDKAKHLIETLRRQYTADRFTFDLSIAMYISGDSNKRLRQEIMQILTGEQKPRALSKCGMYAVSDMLKAHYEQMKLF
jgi:hypothetical protein